MTIHIGIKNCGGTYLGVHGLDPPFKFANAVHGYYERKQ